MPAVSVHPYFKARPGQLEAVRALLPEFVRQTSTEPGALFYEFSVNGDEVFCREAYRDADATMAHLKNVEELLGRMLQISDLTRLEFHGPAAEIEKLKPQLDSLKPTWFVIECGVER